jgi:hypothetical protein
MANDNAHDALEKRALGAILSNAFFTWPSAVNIALFVLLFVFVPLPFAFWQQWMWLLLGVVGEAVYLYATVTDPKAGSEAVRRMLIEKYNPATINNVVARQRVQKALDYKALIDKFIGQQDGAFKVSLQDAALDINKMIELIYQLARKIDAFEIYAQGNQTSNTVASDLASMKKRLSMETDASVQAELSDGIQIKQQLLDQLDHIDSTAKRAEIQMDNTLTQLSTMYAQMQLMDAKTMDGGRTTRLRQDIRDQISALSDTISAMDDVYQRPGGSSSATGDAASSRLADDDSASGISTTSGTSRAQSSSGRRSN